jgi:outer membrane lipoprotein-sorting protein
MKLPKLAVVSLTALLLSPTTWAQQNNELGWTMDRAIRQLDQQGSDFESVLAEVDVEWSGTADDPDRIRSGRIYINERGEFRINVDQPKNRVILMEGKTVHHYDKEAARVDRYSLSRHKNRLEPYIPMGFTMTGKALEQDFLVAFIGEEIIGDRRTLGLELTPESRRMREVVAKIQIWFDEASWLPARQVITQAGGAAALTVDYRGTARNLRLNPDLFDDNWPRGTDKNNVRAN